MKIGIVRNHSIKWFIQPSEEIAAALVEMGHEPIIKTNKDLLCEKTFPFERCVFLDKDLSLAERMELSNVRLFNNAGAIELCDDKRRTYEMLKEIFPVPDTEIFPLTYFIDDAFVEGYKRQLVSKLGLPMIAKLASGSQGREISLLETENDVEAYIRANYPIPHLYQKFISSSRGRDLRVYVVGNEVRASMLRKNDNDFRSNIALGGTGERFETTPEIENLCTEIVSFLGLDFAGIDLLFGENGEMLVCEVNSNAMFSSLNEVCGVNIARDIAEHVVNVKTFADGMS